MTGHGKTGLTGKFGATDDDERIEFKDLAES